MDDSIAARRRIAEFLFDAAEKLLDGGYNLDVPDAAFVVFTSPQGYAVDYTPDISEQDWLTITTVAEDRQFLHVFGVDMVEQRRISEEVRVRARQEYEHHRPFACELERCNDRFRTERGLYMHHARSVFHKHMVSTGDGVWVNRDSVPQ